MFKLKMFKLKINCSHSLCSNFLAFSDFFKAELSIRKKIKKILLYRNFEMFCSFFQFSFSFHTKFKLRPFLFDKWMFKVLLIFRKLIASKIYIFSVFTLELCCVKPQLIKFWVSNLKIPSFTQLLGRC